MEFVSQFSAVFQVARRLPQSVLGAPAFPIHEVEGSPSRDSGVQDFSDFPFFLAFDFDRRVGRLYLPGKGFLWYGSSSDTWKTGWIRVLGISSLYACLLSPTISLILYGPSLLKSSFFDGLVV